MADEIVKIIRVETGGSATTVKELKEEISSLRDALLNTEKGSEEYKSILEQLIDDQKKLTDTMRAGQNEVKAAEGSYNALVNQMAALKKVWRETTDEASRAEIGKQINAINDQLKDLDSSIGNNQRKVGAYTQSITQAFGSMGSAAKGMIGPLASVDKGLTAISSHPVVGVITLLVSLLTGGLAKGFASSEEAANKLTVAFSGFKAIGDAVTNMFQGLAKVVGDLTLGFVNFLDKLGLLGPKFKARQELAKKNIELEKKERDAIVEKAKVEEKVADLREKASNSEKYSIEQRIAFLREAQVEEEKGLELEKQLTEQKLAQLEAQYNLTDSTGKELKELEELKAKVIRINAQISASQKSSNKEIEALRRRGISEAVAARNEYLNIQKGLIQQEYDLAEDGSKEQLRLAKELRTKELEIQKNTLKQKIKNRQDYETALKLAVDKYNKDILKLETDHARRDAQDRLDAYYGTLLRGTREGSKEYYALMAEEQEARKKLAKEQGKLETETQEEFDKRIYAFEQSAKKYRDMGIQAAEEETQIINQIILNSIKPMSAYYRKQIDQLKEYYDTMQKLETETREQFEARQDEAWKKYLEANVNMQKALMGEKDLAERVKKKNNEIYGSVLDNLEDMFQLYKEKFDYSSITLRNAIEMDLVNISNGIIDGWKDVQKKFTGDTSTGKWTLYEGLMPTPEVLNAILNKNEEYLVEHIARFKELSSNELATEINNLYDSFILDIAEKGLVDESLITAYLDNLKGMVDAEKDILDERMDNWMNLSDGIGSIVSNIADFYEEDLKNQVQAGKKSEEQAEKEFENIKAMRIAVAIIDTIQGALAAFMGWQDKGQPWGAIIGAVQAAAVAAAGAAQIAQISNTKFGSSGSGSAGSVAMATVTPTMVDYQPQMTGNLTGQQETEEMVKNIINENPIRAYVVESDITSAQQLASQRSEESTF